MYLTVAGLSGPWIPNSPEVKAGNAPPPTPLELEVHGQAWIDRYLRSFSGTIAGGTSQIQRNIIAERILGLPREPRG